MGIIRTLLAISVILAHSGPLWGIYLVDGFMAVETFFIISGFYMTLILESKYVGKNSYKLFITNRLLRIYPIYWSILAMVIFASVMTGLFTGKWANLSPYIQWHHNMGIPAFLFTIISNLLILGQDAAMFLGLNIKTGMLFFTENYNSTQPQFCRFLIIPQAWSLSVELVFYLIAPLILRKNIKFILWFIFASLLLRIYIYFGLEWINAPWSYQFLPTEMFFFLMGNISYRIYGFIKDNQACRKPSVCLMVAFLLILFLYQYIPIGKVFKLLIYYSFVIFSLPFIFNLTKNSKKDHRIGELSYPIYLVHVFVIGFLTPVIRWLGFESFRSLILVILSVLAAFILLKIIVDPVEEFRQARWKIKTRANGLIVKDSK